jgi:hypothetical protein
MRWRTGLALSAGVLLTAAPGGVMDRRDVPGYLGSFPWRMDDMEFGGFSGLELSDEGTTLVALTDRGAVVTGRIIRDAGNRIDAIESEPPVLLAVPPGPLPEEFRFDTEGLALDGAGGLFVSAELVTRLIRYAAPDSAPDVLPVPPEFGLWEINGGPEGLAIGSDGTLYTLPEVTPREDGTFPLLRFRDGRWDEMMRIEASGDFLPVGADIGPDGRLYLLERRFHGLGGFASRLRRLALQEGKVAPGEVLVETKAGMFGNLEGLALWRDGTGALRATLISDDNFLPVLGTELVEFRLPD